VERQADPADRRARRVVTTDAGGKRLAQAETQLRRVEEHLLAGLDSDESTAFRSMLRRAAVCLATEAPPADACTVIDEVRGS